MLTVTKLRRGRRIWLVLRGGRLADHYWCRRKASGVALAEIRRHKDALPPVRRLLKWLRLWHPYPEYRIYRQTDWVTVEYPRLAALLHDCDVLEVKAGEPAAEKWERDFCREIKKEPSRIEDYYQRAGEKQGRLHYLAGMVLFGLGIVVVAGFASAGALAAFHLLNLHAGGVRRFYACMAAGAVGAIVSVLIRMGGSRGGFNIDHELGSSGVRRLGAMRPLIGAISGVAVSLIVQTTLVPIRHKALTFDFFVVAAFLAGFSERWTKVVLDGAMRTIEKVDDDHNQKGKQQSGRGASSRTA